MSGDALVGEDDFSLFDTIPDGGESVEEQATRELYLHQLRRTLDRAMNELPSQQEMILRAHYYDELPRDEIAKELMCTQSNVGQQEQAALGRAIQSAVSEWPQRILGAKHQLCPADRDQEV